VWLSVKETAVSTYAAEPEEAGPHR